MEGHRLVDGFAIPLSGTLDALLEVQQGGDQMGELIDKAKGKVKQAAGDLTGNKELKQEGERDEFKGKLEGVVRDLKDLNHSVKDAAQ